MGLHIYPSVCLELDTCLWQLLKKRKYLLLSRYLKVGFSVNFSKVSVSLKESCPISLALNVIEGKWKLQIIWILNKHTQRFGQLKRMLPTVSEKILIQQLKELTSDGIISRLQYPEVPPKVEYSLTDKGMQLIPLLELLKQWSEKYLMNDYLQKKHSFLKEEG